MSVGHDMTALPSGGGEVIAPLAPMGSRRGRGLTRFEIVWPPVLLAAIIIGLWYLVTYVVLDEDRRFLMPAPHQVWTDGFLGEFRQGQSNWSLMFNGLKRTATIAAMGLGISIVLGTTVAIVMSQSKRFERAIYPFAVMLSATPILALVPLIGFWFGYSTNPRVIVCVIISLFPIIANTLFGLQSAERGMHDLFTLQHTKRPIRLRKLMFPAAMPSIFTGLRIAATLCVIGAIVGDFFFGQGAPGLGQVLKRATSQNASELLFATIIVACLLSVAVFLLVSWLNRRVTGRWYDGDTAAAR